MYAELGLDIAPRDAAIVFGLALGLVFGILAEVSRFCFRRAVAGPAPERAEARGTWAAGLAVALIATQAAVAYGPVGFGEHRFLAAELPWLAIIAGGALFGAGMVLTRGCVSRLTVLSGSGNLRAVLVLVLFAVVAHATLKGVLAPVRTSLGAATIDLGEFASLAALPGGGLAWAAALAAAALVVSLRSGAPLRNLVLGGLIGLLAAVGWLGTGYVLFDEFDPIAMESLSFTSPAAESLFWAVASSSIPAGFGTGLVGGVLAGALVASVAGGRFAWQSFESPAQTGRYLAGAVLMGVGGVLAGGCTVGAGLSGVPTLSVAALLALVAIGVGGRVTAGLLGELTPRGAGYGAPQATPQVQPAE